MQPSTKRERFEETVLPHLDAAYNLARWLTGLDQDAEDVVQEATLRAFKFFDGFRGGDSRAWFLTVVRNTAFTWIRQNRQNGLTASFDDEQFADEALAQGSEEALIEAIDQEALREALVALPVIFREVIVLHDIEGLAYKEIAAVANIPIGTVMSRLARARQHLHHALTNRLNKEP